jgi:hypothetical protein
MSRGQRLLRCAGQSLGISDTYLRIPLAREGAQMCTYGPTIRGKALKASQG